MSGSDVKEGFQRASAAKNKTPAPFSLRLTFEERAMLEHMAGDRPLGAFIRGKLFGEKARPRALHQRAPGP